jgi:hypothetical protein
MGEKKGIWFSETEGIKKFGFRLIGSDGLIALRFIDFKTSESQNFKGWFRFAQLFLNRQNSLFDVGRSMFDLPAMP